MTAASTPRVLCFVPYGSWLVHNQLDCIVGTALRVRGAEVTLLTCDGLFQEDCYVLAHSKNQAEDCRSCAARGMEFFSKFPLPLLQLRPYTRDEDWREIEDWLTASNIPELSGAVYKGHPLGEWVRASVRSYHVVNPRNLALPQVQALFRKYIRYTWVTFKAAQRFLEEFRPTHMTMFGGYGFLHAPFFAAAQASGCRLITHERGSLPSRFMVASDDYVDIGPALFSVVKAWEEIPLNEEEFSKVRSMYFDWEAGKGFSMGSFYKSQSDPSAVRSQLAIPPDLPIMVVFTSGEHELPTEEFRREGGKQLELISKLIEIFRHRGEYLVIRHHPNLGAGIRSRLDYNYLSRAYRQLDNLPPNVRIMMPNEQLTSYAVLWNATACIAFMSTLASESVARGLPTATLPLSAFAGTATHQITDQSIAGLSALVDELLTRGQREFNEADLRRTYSYARAQHLRYATLFKSFGIRNTHEFDIRVSSANDLLPGVDPALDRVCDFVMKNTPIYDLPVAADRDRSRTLEHELLRSELERLRAIRKEVQSSTVADEAVSPTLVLMVVDGPATGDCFTSSGLCHQRKAPIEYRSIGRSADLFRDLLAQLTHSKSEFALVTSPRFSYDEGFVRCAAAFLQRTPQFEAVRFAGWTVRNGEILHYLFTDHNPVQTFRELQNAVASPVLPECVAGFGFFRRHALLRILEQIDDSPGDPAEVLFEEMKGGAVLRHPFPALRFELT